MKTKRGNNSQAAKGYYVPTLTCVVAGVADFTGPDARHNRARFLLIPEFVGLLEDAAMVIRLSGHSAALVARIEALLARAKAAQS